MIELELDSLLKDAKADKQLKAELIKTRESKIFATCVRARATALQ